MGETTHPHGGDCFYCWFLIVGIVEKYIRFGWDSLDFLSRLTARTTISYLPLVERLFLATGVGGYVSCIRANLCSSVGGNMYH